MFNKPNHRLVEPKTDDIVIANEKIKRIKKDALSFPPIIAAAIDQLKERTNKEDN